MADKEKPQPRKGAGKVAAAIAKVFDTVENNGSVITQCVTSAKSVYRGAEIPTVDLAYIADNVARIRSWTPTSINARKSEVRKILRAYRELPEAIEKFRKKSPTFTWHQAVKLARLLGQHSTINKAVAAMVQVSEAARPNAMTQVLNCLTRIANVETRSQKVIAFRKDLNKLIAKHGL